MSIKINPHLEIIIATILWSTTGLFVKYLSLPPTTLTFFRLSVPTIFLFLFFIKDRLNIFKTKNKMMLVASLLNAVRMFFYFVAYSLTSIGNAVIMLYTWPIFASIFSRIILKEKMPKRNYLFFAISFTGIILIYLNKEISFENDDFIGMSSMIISSIVYSFTFIIFKKNSNNYTQYETVFYQNLLGALIFLPFLFINKPLPTVNQAITASIYAVLIGVIGFSLFFSALKRVKATTASFLTYTEVLSTIIIGLIILNETLTWNIVVGGLLIILSSIKLKK